MPKSTKIISEGAAAAGSAPGSRGSGCTKRLPGCGSGMNERIDENLLQVNVIEPHPTWERLMPAASMAGDIIDLDAGDVFQRQHAAGGVFPEDISDIDPGLVPEVGRKTIGVSPFGDKVQFGARGG